MELITDNLGLLSTLAGAGVLAGVLAGLFGIGGGAVIVCSISCFAGLAMKMRRNMLLLGRHWPRLSRPHHGLFWRTISAVQLIGMF